MLGLGILHVGRLNIELLSAVNILASSKNIAEYISRVRLDITKLNISYTVTLLLQPLWGSMKGVELSENFIFYEAGLSGSRIRIHFIFAAYYKPSFM